jgi:hypothetical protein
MPPPGSYYNAATSPIIGPDGTISAALGTILYEIASATNGPANFTLAHVPAERASYGQG